MEATMQGNGFGSFYFKNKIDFGEYNKLIIDIMSTTDVGCDFYATKTDLSTPKNWSKDYTLYNKQKITTPTRKTIDVSSISDSLYLVGMFYTTSAKVGIRITNMYFAK